MKNGLNFIAIDFETATPKRASICEVGICVVRNGEVVETRSWLVQPKENLYSYLEHAMPRHSPGRYGTFSFFP